MKPIALLACLITASCARAQQPNILLVIADDLGLDPTPGYMPGPQKANMPHLQALMDGGLTFDNLWVDPLCSPTRSTILTGRYGLHTGVLNAGTASLLPPDEVTLHQYLNDINSGYASAIIGKWHLGGMTPDPTYPTTMGIPHYAGLLSGGVANYYNWNFCSNGTIAPNTNYITTTFTDLAIDWIGDQSGPWFCWLAYNAPHVPLHLPPLNMHSQGALPTDAASINANPLPYYLAMAESVDHELGRLQDSLGAATWANTVVIFMGDNGTDAEVIQAPYAANKAKGTLYQGGVHTPLVISGPAVTRTGEREPAIVNSSDLFTTIVELTGNMLPSYYDSRSLAPMLTTAGLSARPCAYTEVLATTGGFAWRNERYKLIDPTTGPLRFYDLLLDPYEVNSLIPGTLNAEEQAAYNQLVSGCGLITGMGETRASVLHPYPQPASDRVYLPGVALGSSYHLMHTDGRLIRNTRLDANGVDLSSLARGIYLISVLGNANGRQVARVVKE